MADIEYNKYTTIQLTAISKQLSVTCPEPVKVSVDFVSYLFFNV